MKTAGEIIGTTISQFPSSDGSLHEQICRAEFLARLAVGLAAAQLRTEPDLRLSLRFCPTLGSLESALRALAGTGGQCRELITVADAGLQLLTARFPSTPRSRAEGATLREVRNQLFHAAPIRADRQSRIAAEVRIKIDDTLSQIQTALADAELEGSAEKCELLIGSSRVELTPLLQLDNAADPRLFVFSRLLTEDLILYPPDDAVDKRVSRGPHRAFLDRLFCVQDDGDRQLAELCQSAVDDLEGFKEIGSRIEPLSNDDELLIEWTRATGGASECRRDRLRIGKDNRWEWFGGDRCGWVGYTELLRAISDWPVLCMRIRHLLDAYVEALGSDERQLLRLVDGLHTPPYIPPTVRMVEETTSSPLSIEDWMRHVDEDIEKRRDNTILYFVHAEAGAGKTTVLLRAAKSRAEECEQDNGSGPLLLYISARGNVLESLDQAVGAAVSETRILTPKAVRALCRNGLIVPIVDGFDELVGSVTYSDALASLRPWLEALCGRGVMIVSARSNYFVGLFQKSIALESNRGIKVRRRIVTLDRWNTTQRDRYFNACGVSSARLDDLTDTERGMLCLPFFARVSLELLSGSNLTGNGSLIGSLMEGYLRREQEKLKDATGARLIGTTELSQLFEELAEFMFDNHTREIGFEDLSLCAEATLSSFGPEQRNRLGALCGLSVQGSQDPRFRFMHELVFDYYLGLRLGRRLKSAEESVPSLLKKAPITPGAIRGIVEVCPLTVDALIRVGGLVKTLRNEAFRVNIGLLWQEYLREAPALTDITIVGAKLESVEVSEGRPMQSVRFEECEIDILRVGSGALVVKFIDCAIQELRIDAQSSRGVTFSGCRFDTAVIRRDYFEVQGDIVKALRETGAEVESVQDDAEPERSDAVEDARYFLQKLVNRGLTTSLVVGEDREPTEDDRSARWFLHRREAWRPFLRRLEEAGLVELVRVNASGAPKRRLKWTVPPLLVLEGQHSPEVDAFWASCREVS